MGENTSGESKLHNAVSFLKIFEILAELGFMAVGFKGMTEAKTTADKVEIIKQQSPHLFGLGKADEQIWGALLVQLSSAQVDMITNLMTAMSPHEREQFRVVVTGIRTKAETGDKDHRINIEFTDDDTRVKFLKKIARQVKASDVQTVLEMLRAHQLVNTNTSNKGREFLSKFLGLADIADLADPAKVTEAINNNLRSKIQAQIHKIENPTSKLEAIVGRLIKI